MGKFNQIALSVGLGLFAVLMLLAIVEKGMELVLLSGLAECSFG